MKKNIYLILTFLIVTPCMATQHATNSLIIASTLVIRYGYDEDLSLDLHEAIEQGNYSSAKEIIANSKADVNAKVDYDGDWSSKIDGCTPLIWCCYKGDKWLGIVKALLTRKDINVNLQNNYGNTPLIMCCIKGNESLAIAKLLLARKNINVNLPSKYGTTPLIGCAWKGDTSLSIARLLLDNKYINVNLQDKDDDTPLDIIICQISNNTENYTYVNLWNLLVAEGTILIKHKEDYKNLNPSDFKEPEKGYIEAIKSNPPINLSSLLTRQLAKKCNLLRKQVEECKNKTNSINFLDEGEAKEQE